MSPNGRRAWRRFAKQQRRKVNRKNRNTGTPWINDADGAFYRHEQKHFAQRPALPPQSFTARSLVGMTMGARKRRAWREYLAWCRKNLDRELLKSATIDTWNEQGLEEGYQRGLQAQHDVRAKYRIGERLRPCPGCCACWGCEQDPTRINPVSGNTLHWAGPKRKHTFECPMGPPLAGKKSKQIARMLKWQETLPDDCDGSGVLPARKQP